MRATPLLRLALGGLALALPLGLTACSSSPASSSSTTGATASTGGTSDKGATTTKVSCGSIPASEVNADLGTSLGPPSSEVQGTVTVCTYKSSTAPQSAIVRIETGTNASAFAASESQFASQGQATSPASGLGDRAYTSTMSGGGITNSTVVVLKGTTSVLVTGSATVPQVEALATHVLGTL